MAPNDLVFVKTTWQREISYLSLRQVETYVLIIRCEEFEKAAVRRSLMAS